MQITKVKFHYVCVGCPNCHFQTDNLREANQHSGIHHVGNLEVQKEVIETVEIS